MISVGVRQKARNARKRIVVSTNPGMSTKYDAGFAPRPGLLLLVINALTWLGNRKISVHDRIAKQKGIAFESMRLGFNL